MQYDNWTASDAIDKSLIDNDIFYLNGEISAETVAPAIKWILSANLKIKPKRTLKLYINTYGGEVYEAFALIDIMKQSRHNIATYGVGAVMSAGFLIFASGEQGHRYIGKNTGIMNHQHSDHIESKLHDMKSAMIENNNCEYRSLHILRDATGYSLAKVKEYFDSPSDQYYTAKDLIKLKIADHIL